MRGSNESNRATARGWRRLWKTLPLLLPLSMMTCAPKASSQRTVIVESAEINRLDAAHYRVTTGWLINRMRVEAGLKAALDRCTLDLESERARPRVGWHNRFLDDRCRRCPECCATEGDL